jgi:hypothetical protein
MVFAHAVVAGGTHVGFASADRLLLTVQVTVAYATIYRIGTRALVGEQGGNRPVGFTDVSDTGHDPVDERAR